jgi:hypothetical protein
MDAFAQMNLAVTVLLAALDLLTLTPLCGLSIYDRVPSPSGQQLAVIFGKDCGATTGFNNQVSIFPATGEVFSADEYPPFVIVDGRNNVFVTWTNDASISVVLPSSEKCSRNSIALETWR